MSDTLDNWRKRRASPSARLAINLPVGPKHVWWLLCCTFVLSILHADVDAHAASGSRHTRQRALQTGPPAPTDASCEVAWDMSAHSNCAPGGACAPCEPCFTNANQGSYAGTCGCFETARGGPQCVEGYAECPPCGQSCLHCVTTAAQSRGDCPAGTFSEFIALSSDSNSCTSCEPGQSDRDADPSTPCQACAHGRYSALVGSVGECAGVCSNGTQQHRQFAYRMVPGVLYKRWRGIPGTDVAQMVSHPTYLDTLRGPDVQDVFPELFEAPVNVCNNCGTEMEAYFMPSETGPHVFHIASDDQGHLWAGESQEAAEAQDAIALVPGWTNARQWTKYPAQSSAPIELVAGTAHYLKAIANEGGGGDNLAVGVTTPSGLELKPIPVSANGHAYLAPKSVFPQGWNSSAGCAACPAGRTDQDSDPGTDCTPCPAGRYSDLTGASGVCAVCPNGTYAAPESTGCTSCVAGQSDDDSDSSTPCALCSLGRFSETVQSFGECEGACARGTQQLVQIVPGVHYKRWRRIPRTNVEEMLSHLSSQPDYLDTLSGPDVQDVFPELFEAPEHVCAFDRCFSEMEAYFMPSETGPHVFHIAADDQGYLWAGESQEAAEAQDAIALVPEWTHSRQWTKFATQSSAPIELVAGTAHYLKAIEYAGEWGDSLAVGVTTPSGLELKPIPVSANGHAYLVAKRVSVGWNSSAGCAACPAGRTDQDSDPGTDCRLCSAGRYSDLTGASGVCAGICPNGTYAAPGSTDLTNCTSCVAGQSDDDSDSSTPCALCSPGRYSSVTGLVYECASSCLAGAYAAAGSRVDADCITCQPGQYDQDYSPSTPCALCLEGRYTVLAGVVGECDGSCPIGTYAAAGATNCTDCEPGQSDHDADPSTPCQACAHGRYSARVGSVGECAGVCSNGTQQHRQFAYRMVPGVLYKRWHGIEGSTIYEMVSHPTYLDTLRGPDVQDVFPELFEAPENVCNSCGTEMEAYFTPSETGPHVFHIASDDQGHLWAGESQEAAEAQDAIALVPGWTFPRQWEKYPAQSSAPIELVAGTAYYLKAIANEDDGELDNLAVGVTTPSGLELKPIPVSANGHAYLAAKSVFPQGWNSSAGCAACPAGRTDQDSDPGTDCTLCSAGRYSDLTGVIGASGVCAGICPNGTYAAPGSTDLTNCTSCVAGQSDDDSDSSTPCALCSPGRFSSATELVGECQGTCSAGMRFKSNVLSVPGALFQRWHYIGRGVDIDQSLTLDHFFATKLAPGDPPDEQYVLTRAFESCVDCCVYCGTIITAVFIPKHSGFHVFHVASDQNSFVWLEDTLEQISEVSRELIMEGSRGCDDWECVDSGQRAGVLGWTYSRQWDRYPEQESPPISLTAGKQYMLKAIVVTGGNGDNLAVGVTLPSGDSLAPIPVETEGHTWLRAPMPGGGTTESTSCTQCPSGRADTDHDAASECERCRLWEYGDQIGQTTCNSCTVGMFADPVARNCTDCEPGQSDHDADPSTPCQACAHGRYSALVGSVGECAGVCSNGTQQHRQFQMVPGVLYKRWRGIPGTDVAQMVSHPTYLDTLRGPDVQDVFPELFEAPVNVCNNCGTEMEAYFMPSETGPHVFHIASNEQGHLWAGESQEAAEAQDAIALVPRSTNARQWEKFATQSSAPIELVAGTAHYLKAIANEGGGGDNLAVGVTTPSGLELKPIPVSANGHAYLSTKRFSLGWNSSTGCVACPAGRTDQDSDPETDCTLCPAGRYSDLTGASGVCAGICPNGTYAAPGSTDLTNCTSCVAGQSDDDSDSSTPCALCSPGRFSETVQSLGECEGACARGTQQLVQIVPGVLYKRWRGIPESDVAQMVSHPTYLDTLRGPDVQDVFPELFEAPENVCNNCGTEMEAYFMPSETGPHVFHIAAAFYGHLWAGESQEAAETQDAIALVPGWTFPRQWEKFATQSSAPIELVAGTAHYLKAIANQARWGGDSLAVGVTTPSGLELKPIPVSANGHAYLVAKRVSVGWNSSAGCAACPAGRTDQDSDPGTDCTPCPAGRYSDLTGASGVCAVCPNGTYAAPESTGCTSCVAGQSDDDSDSSTPCALCSPGRFSTTENAVGNCVGECPTGSMSEVTGVSCLECPVGRSDVDADARTDCTLCSAGRYSNLTGVIGPCASICPDGSFVSTDSTNCTNCELGQSDHDADPATPCAQCSPGRYSDSLGDSGECTQQCSPGTYALPGSATPADCTSCEPGQSDHDADPSTPCQLCPHGRYSALVNATGACGGTCPSGTEQQPLGAQSGWTSSAGCAACPAGRTDHDLDPGTDCTPCSAGRYSDAIGASGVCAGICLSGTYAAPGSTVSTGCTSCVAGQSDDDSDSSTPCTLCSPGRYSSVANAAGACIRCPGGSFSHQGARICSSCVPGRVDHDNNSATQCMACPYGRYSTQVGAIGECGGVCPIGTEQMVQLDGWESDAGCLACPPGKVGLSDPPQCGYCEPGQYTDVENATACTRCPFGTVAHPGDSSCRNCSLSAIEQQIGTNQARESCRGVYQVSDGAQLSGRGDAVGRVEFDGEQVVLKFANITGSEQMKRGLLVDPIKTTWHAHGFDAAVAAARNASVLSDPNGLLPIGAGGGILTWNSFVAIDYSFFQHLVAVTGGAMHLRYRSHAVVKHTEFSYNSAHSSLAQSICRCLMQGEPSPWIQDAAGQRCGWQVDCETVVFGESQVEVGRGGAIYVDESSILDVESSLFRSNCAKYGGAMYIAEGGGSAIFKATLFLQNGVKTDTGRCDKNFVGESVATYIAFERPDAATDDSGRRRTQGVAPPLTGFVNAIPHKEEFFLGASTDGPQGGGAIMALEGSSLNVTDVTFLQSQATEPGIDLYVHLPEFFYARDTSYIPYSITSVYLTFVADCEIFPCALGHSCRYLEHSLQCLPCEGELVGLDGRTCSQCPAGTGRNADRTDCALCPGNAVSLFGVCTECPAGSIAAPDKILCSSLTNQRIQDPQMIVDILRAGVSGTGDPVQVQTTMLIMDISAAEATPDSEEQEILISELHMTFCESLNLPPTDIEVSGLRVANVTSGRRRVQSGVAANFDVLIRSSDTSCLNCVAQYMDGLLAQLENSTSVVMTGLRTRSLGFVDFRLVCPAGQVRKETHCDVCDSNQWSNKENDVEFCDQCPASQVSNAVGDGCICDDGYYNSSTHGWPDSVGGGSLFHCYSEGVSFDPADFAQAQNDQTVCRRCDLLGDCLECKGGVATVAAGYSPNTIHKEGVLDTLPGSKPLFKCHIQDDNETQGQCLGSNGVKWCSEAYDGPLCSNCAAGFGRSGLNRDAPCKPCNEVSTLAGPIGLFCLLCTIYALCYKLIQHAGAQVDADELTDKRGVVLVIANCDYTFWPTLTTPASDGRHLADDLERADYSVHLIFDADALAMRKAIEMFGEMRKQMQEAQRKDVPAILFYFGHGCQVDGQNHLVPVDCPLEGIAKKKTFDNEDADALQLPSKEPDVILLRSVVEHVVGTSSEPSVFILEASHEINDHLPEDITCAITGRLMTTPVRLVAEPEGPCYEQAALQQYLERSDSSPSGELLGDTSITLDVETQRKVATHLESCALSKMTDLPDNTLMLTAASAGTLATSVSASRGTLTEALLENILQPQSAVSLLRTVRERVIKMSRGHQIPWICSTLVDEGSFSLVDGAAGVLDDIDQDTASIVLEYAYALRALQAEARSLVPNARTMVGLTQILIGIEYAFSISFPPIFRTLLRMLKVLALDIVDFFNMGCTVGFSYYGKFFAWTIAPPCVLGCLYAAYWWQVRAWSLDEDNPRRHHMFDRLLHIAFNFLFLIYPIVCQTIFKVYLCQEIGNEEAYLSTDFQVDCNSMEYMATVASATIMVFIYPVGIPGILLLVLFFYRKQLLIEGSEIRDYLDPLVGGYRVECYYWEALEMLRKVILTGLIVFFAPGTVQQLLFGCIISTIFMGLAIWKLPYLTPFNNRFKIVTDAAIVMTFNMAVLLHPSVVQDIASYNNSEFVLGLALIVVNFGVPLALIAYELRQYNGSEHREGKWGGDQSDEFNNPLGVDPNLDEGPRDGSSRRG